MKSKKLFSLILVILMLVAIPLTSYASNDGRISAHSSSETLVINLNGNLLTDKTVKDIVELQYVQNFFEENELDIEYYMNWLTKKNVKADSVSFCIVENTNTHQNRSSNSVIQDTRIVYGKVTQYEQSPEEIEFEEGEAVMDVISEGISFIIADKFRKIYDSIITLFGWTNLDIENIFGSTRATFPGGDYIEHECNHRIITKFVELYAPLGGTGSIRWYPYGYAESDYSVDNFIMYYDGAIEDTESEYWQCYTQRYYLENGLTNMVCAAYPNTYEEAATEDGAEYGDYYLVTRQIDKDMYKEYDSEF